MSSSAERQNLLAPSQHRTGYETLCPQDNDVNSTRMNMAACEEQPGQEIRPGTTQRLDEQAENQENTQQRRQNSCLSSCLSSYRPLKYSAIAFGLWSELGRWSLFLIIPIALLIPALNILNAFSYECNSAWPTRSKNDTYTFSFYPKSTQDKCTMALVQLLSYLMMLYCIRRLSRQPRVLRLPQAFRLAKKSKSVNIVLLVSIFMLVFSMFWINHYPLINYSHEDFTGHIPLGLNRQSYLAWQFFNSIIAWQAVISCLVFNVILKALAVLVDQCLDRIITMQADSVDHYIQVHQELCCVVQSTFAAFKKWLFVNTVAYALWIFLLVTNKFSVFQKHVDESLQNSSCSFLSITDDLFFYWLPLIGYALFVCYYPWYSVPYLKRSFNRLVLRLNDKTDWNNQHPFRNRSHLNMFLQYAKNTKFRPFMRLTCSALLPYISALLAVSGLILTLYNRSQQKGNDMKKEALVVGRY